MLYVDSNTVTLWNNSAVNLKLESKIFHSGRKPYIVCISTIHSLIYMHNFSVGLDYTLYVTTYVDIYTA